MPEQIGPAHDAAHEADRAEHKAMRAQLSRLGRELAKLGVEFEQHRNDTKVYADGIFGLVSSLAPRTRGTE